MTSATQFHLPYYLEPCLLWYIFQVWERCSCSQALWQPFKKWIYTRIETGFNKLFICTFLFCTLVFSSFSISVLSKKAHTFERNITNLPWIFVKVTIYSRFLSTRCHFPTIWSDKFTQGYFEVFFLLLGGFLFLLGFGISFFILRGCSTTACWPSFGFLLRLESSSKEVSKMSLSSFSKESDSEFFLQSSSLSWSHGTFKLGTLGIIAFTASTKSVVFFLNPKARTHFKPMTGAILSLRRGTWQAGTILLKLNWIRCEVMIAGLADLHTRTKSSSFLSRALVTSLTPMASCFLTWTEVHPDTCWLSSGFLSRASLVSTSMLHFSLPCFFEKGCFLFLLLSSIFWSPIDLNLSSSVCKMKCISSLSRALQQIVYGLFSDVFTVKGLVFRTEPLPGAWGATAILKILPKSKWQRKVSVNW